MKHYFKSWLGLSLMSLAVVAAPAFANVDVSGENHLTGFDSDNRNLHDVLNDVDTNVSNDGDVDNRADADVETGRNEQNDNTEAGDIETGAVDVSTDWENLFNRGSSLVDVFDLLEVRADFENSITGADSTNLNRLDVRNDIDTVVRNTADILNRLDVDANTGRNEQNRNTLGGDIETGDVEVSAGIVNEANNNTAVGGRAGGFSVDATGQNDRTGFNSFNENRVDVSNDVDTLIRNNADINNNIDVDANTGRNEQNRNTIGGDIETGDVEVDTDIRNYVNNNTGRGVVLPEFEVEADFSNHLTGADSTNVNRLDVRNDVDTHIENQADINNRLDVDANTGRNEQNRNTEGGSINTGDVEIRFDVTNAANNG